MNNLKAVFFDADDTLINHKECEKQALKYLFDNIGISYKNEYQNIFRPLDRMLWENETILPKDIPTHRFKIFFEKINIDYKNFAKANDLFKKGLANAFALTENAEKIIKYLHNKGYSLYVVTNGLIELQRPRVTNSKIGKFISYVMVSEEVGAKKPNPLIFNILLQKINFNPNEVIMVGDSLKNDIQGAKNANIKSVWFNPERIKNETDIIPDYEITDLLQLTKIL
ncbi:MAG: YjjG family noncanonical pyrimidine nucleotidase [Defluviitaleaceae bacterium]|nr:YjjG family noncanonical pyrimidine nucleotidase [Defluviitaleaceae bacterium]